MRPDVVDSRRTNGAILVSMPITDRSSRQPSLACAVSEFAFGSLAREIPFEIAFFQRADLSRLCCLTAGDLLVSDAAFDR